MNNLINKLIKPLLIPALSLSLNSSTLSAQDNHPLKINFSNRLNFCGVISNYNDLKIYDNWKDHFEDLNGDEKLKYFKFNVLGDLGMGLDFGISLNRYSLGITSEVSLREIMGNQRLAYIELHDWKYDYTKILDIKERTKIPDLGVYFQIPTKNKDYSIILRASMGKSEIIEERREDKSLKKQPENPNKLKCEFPEDNTKKLTKVFERKKTIYKNTRIGIEFNEKSNELDSGVELYYETNWDNMNTLGLSISYYIF